MTSPTTPQREEPAIVPKPRAGAYLCDSTARHADYWLKGGRELHDRDEAVMAVEQSINAWKNLAYALAEKLHYAGYDPESGHVAPLSEIGPNDWHEAQAEIINLQRGRERLRSALTRVLSLAQHEPLGNLGNALAEIAREALKEKL